MAIAGQSMTAQEAEIWRQQRAAEKAAAAAKEAKIAAGKKTAQDAQASVRANAKPNFVSDPLTPTAGINPDDLASRNKPAFTASPTGIYGASKGATNKIQAQNGILDISGYQVDPNLVTTKYYPETNSTEATFTADSFQAMKETTAAQKREEEYRNKVSSILTRGDSVGKAETSILPSILDFSLIDEEEKQIAKLETETKLQALAAQEKDEFALLNQRMDQLAKDKATIPENLRDNQEIRRREAQLISEQAIAKARFEKERYEAQAAYEEGLIEKQNKERAAQITARNARLGISSDSNAIDTYNEVVREGENAMRFMREKARSTSAFLESNIANIETNLAINLDSLDQDLENSLLEFDRDLDSEIFKLRQDVTTSRAEREEASNNLISDYWKKTFEIERGAAERAQQLVEKATADAEKTGIVDWRRSDMLGYLVNELGQPILDNSEQQIAIPKVKEEVAEEVDRFFTDDAGFVIGVTKAGRQIPIGSIGKGANGSKKVSAGAGQSTIKPVEDKVVQSYANQAAEGIINRNVDFNTGAEIAEETAKALYGTYSSTNNARKDFVSTVMNKAYIKKEEPTVIDEIANAEIPEFADLSNFPALSAGVELGKRNLNVANQAQPAAQKFSPAEIAQQLLK